MAGAGAEGGGASAFRRSAACCRASSPACASSRGTPAARSGPGYYAEADHYSADAAGHKRELIDAFVGIAAPSSVWDLGGDTGVFSRIASERGIPTVCFDVDPGCVEVNYREVVSKGQRNLLPLLMDLTNPSPAIGWDNRERASLAERGPADMALRSR